MLLFLMLPFLLLQACQHQKQSKIPKSNVPQWAHSASWYQIFPERFANGDTTNDPTAERINAPAGWEITPWTSDWYAMAPWQTQVSDKFYDTATRRRYGGDLQGVINRLDYLSELGVNALYFNPIFDAISMHKYDGSTFHHIDRFFGPDPEGDARIMESEDPNDPSTWQWTSADKLFLELLREAKKRNMRIVIDGVFNHTGPDFWAFKDIVNNQKDSKFADWYSILSFDNPLTPENEFDYQGWWGYKGLPEFKEVNDDLPEPVKAYIFASTKRWMDPNGDGDPSDGIDGWRLDVAEEVGKTFWVDWHKHVRSINPEALTIAEIWTDKALEYIHDDLFSIVMNYRWAYPTLDFFVNRTISASQFMERQMGIYASWPVSKRTAMQNLLDSHDTDRLFSMIVNPGREYDRKASPRDPENPSYNIEYPGTGARDILMIMALYQFTWPGAPMVYYGTEAGMWGADDPDDRKPMLWPDLIYEPESHHPLHISRTSDDVIFDDGLYQWYQKLFLIRAQNSALQQGSVQVISTNDQKEVFVFAREDKTQQMMIIINHGSGEFNLSDLASELPLDKFTMVLGTLNISDAGSLTQLSLPPQSGIILRKMP
jgi:cyclomaltodextrinase / maltogenic alpha-amylase / neopullulanase